MTHGNSLCATICHTSSDSKVTLKSSLNFVSGARGMLKGARNGSLGSEACKSHQMTYNRINAKQTILHEMLHVSIMCVSQFLWPHMIQK